MSRWHVYLLRCADGSLYAGLTNDLSARVAAHNAGKGAKYTRSRLPVRLAWSRAMRSQSAARKKEAAIKQMTRAEKETLTLYCFSPFVTAATFALEAALALVVLLRYRHTVFGRLSALLLCLLAVFQLAETMICRGGGALWVPAGWIAITMLPVLGAHLASLIVGPTRFVPVGYACGALLSAGFLLDHDLISAVGCPGNYVAFVPTSTLFHVAYFAYYAAFVGIAGALLLRAWLRGGEQRALTGWMLLGWGSYIVPSAFVYAFFPAPPESFPSVFCGFAVVLAVILAVKVLPLAHRTTRQA